MNCKEYRDVHRPIRSVIVMKDSTGSSYCHTCFTEGYVFKTKSERNYAASVFRKDSDIHKVHIYNIKRKKSTTYHIQIYWGSVE